MSQRAHCAPLYLNKCQVKCGVFGSQDAVRTLKRKACGVDLRLAVIYVRLRKRMVSQADEIVVQLAFTRLFVANRRDIG